jgi:hypothetical protein
MDKELITFHFDGLQIALTNKSYVWIPGNYGYYDDDKPCLIKIKRTLFIKALKDWINQRAEYNKINAYGAGFTEITNYIDLPEIVIGNHFWKELKEEEEFKDINVSVVEALEYYSEMEHG